MREIKFRAWDGENKSMVYDFATFSSGNVIDVPEGRWSHELRLTNKNEIKASLNFKSNDTFETKFIEYIPTMQFTGLKDKNGVEIYEGDIYHHGDPRITYTVVWVDSGLVGKQNSSTSYAGLKSWCDQIEVIGNIYESHELLEETK